MTTSYEHYITIKSNKNKFICSLTENFSEYGHYLIEIFNDHKNSPECTKKAIFLSSSQTNYTKQIVPTNLIAIIGFLFFLYFSPNIAQLISRYVVKLKKLSFSHLKSPKTPALSCADITISILDETQPNKNESKYRLTSLDAFRGLNIILMLFINSGGAGYSLFKHSIWHGMNFAELPHGWFNWIMGVSVALSGSRDRQEITKGERMKKAIHRTSKLLFLGLVVNSMSFTPDLDKIPFFGVLQDLGILYLIVVFNDIIIPRKMPPIKRPQRFALLDIDFLWIQWLILIAATVLHNGLQFGLDVPNCGRGYLGPGGKHRNETKKFCTGGAAGFIDRLLIPTQHMSHGIEFVFVYDSPHSFDPYGPFGLLGQLVQVYFGILAGEMYLLHKEKCKNVMKRWVFLAFLLCCLSFALCNKSLDYCFIPCNRKLWTLTYSCYICSSAFMLLSMLYFIIDVQGLWSGWPAVCPGTNSIFIYVAHGICKHSQFPFDWPTPDTHFHLLFKHLWQVFLWITISAIMYHKKLFLTV